MFRIVQLKKTVKSNDRSEILMLEAVEGVPAIGDLASVNGSGVFRVMNVTLTAPAEETLLYELQLRE